MSENLRVKLEKLAEQLAEKEMTRKRYGQKYPKPSNAIKPVLSNPLIIKNRGFILNKIRQRLSQLSIQKSIPLTYRNEDLVVNTKYSLSTKEQKTLRISPEFCATTDLFSGPGLFAYAAKQSHCKTIEALESNPTRVDTYNANNLAEVKIIPNQAKDWSPVIPIRGNIDLLMGGPPCKPFSRAADLGMRLRGKGITAEDNYFSWTLDWIADLCPRIICFENVLEFIRKEENKDYIQWYLQQLNILGYQGQAWELNSANFGTPQFRKRLFIVAAPIGAPWTEYLTPPSPRYKEPGSEGNLPEWVSAGEAIRTGCLKGFGRIFCKNTGNYENKCLTCTKKGKTPSNFQQAPNSTGSFSRVESIGKLTRAGIPLSEYMKKPLSSKRPDQLRIRKFTPIDQSAERPYSSSRKSAYLSRTITSRSFDLVERFLIPKHQDPLQPQNTLLDQDRYQLINFRDLTKLQDIPNHFIFKGSNTQIKDQPGLGVPILLGTNVLGSLTTLLLRNYRKEGSKSKKDCGDCYEAAARFLQKNGHRNPSLRLVHGEVRGRGKIDGTWFGHAWIEDIEKGIVIEVANNKEIEIPRDAYYALGTINLPYYENRKMNPPKNNIIKYSLPQLREKLKSFQHWGPWDLKTQSGL